MVLDVLQSLLGVGKNTVTGGLFGNANGSPLQGLTNPAQWWDYFKNGKTNDVNKEIADQNLQFQRENLDYEKALQKQIFEREDTAYQRTVNDMRMAGMNPLSMQGTNGAGEAIATEPLHNDFQMQDTGMLSVMSQIFNTVQQLSSMRNNSTITNAQANLINAQADNQNIKNTYESDILFNQLKSLELDRVGKDYSNRRNNIAWLNDARNYNFNEQFGLSDNMPDIIKAFNIATHQGDSKTTNFSTDGNAFFDYYTPNRFNNLNTLLENNNLKGAISESKLGQIFLKMLGIGF